MRTLRALAPSAFSSREISHPLATLRVAHVSFAKQDATRVTPRVQPRRAPCDERGGTRRAREDRMRARRRDLRDASATRDPRANAAAQFSLACRSRAVVARNAPTPGGAAFRRFKFVLADDPSRGGINHRTVRRESTPRLRAESTFHPQRTFARRARTRRAGFRHRSEPNHRGVAPLGPLSWFGYPTEGCCMREDPTRKDHGGPQ